MKNFAFIDVFTQKLYGENFGSRAIPEVSNIRENLMNISALIIQNEYNYIGLRSNNKSFESQDLESLMDTEIDSARTNYSEKDSQIVVENESFESSSYIEEIKKFLKLKSIDTVFIYGLPFEEVVKLGLDIHKLDKKVWIVIDCVKDEKSNERDLIKEYQKQGLKAISFRNLEKYLKM